VGKRVLVVDDHQQVGDAVAEMLRVMGHEATFFSSPATALDWLGETGAVDVAFVDLSMPGTNGVRVLNSLRERGYRFPVAILTGYPESDLARLALAAGAFRVVTKPISMDDLISLVESI
jgi:DNA-binding NtrC family response regulator